MRDFARRIHAGASEFLAQHGITRIDHELPFWSIEKPEERLVLVAHAGTNSVFMCHLLGLQPTPWEWDRFVFGHASVSRLEALPVHDGCTFSLAALSGPPGTFLATLPHPADRLRKLGSGMGVTTAVPADRLSLRSSRCSS
jgi:hypothetical protein